jgi:putative ABC transport system permease protein
MDADAEIREELRLHMEGRVEEYMAQGLSEAEARERAEARFGSLDRAVAECRDAEAAGGDDKGRGLGMAIEQVLSDVRFAIRGLRRRPTFTGAALLTLTLAVGASTAVFSVINGVLIRPLPHPEPDELVLVWEWDQRSDDVQDHNPVTIATYLDWRREAKSFESMAAFGVFPMTIRGERGPQSVMGAIVTADFFRVLQSETTLGRTFAPDEDQPGPANSVAVISHEYWQSEFGGDPDVLGRKLAPTSERDIVDVLAPGFEFLDERPQVFLPFTMDPETVANRMSHTARVLARLAPGVGLDAAQSEMNGISASLTALYPEALTGFEVNVESLAAHVVGSTRQALLVLMAAVGVVLLIGCVNVANLMLTRSLTEQRQDAVRAAVGASRGRLMQQRLTEALVLALIGGAMGVILAAGAIDVLVAVAPPSLPRIDEIGMDPGVLGFALAVTVAVGVAFGLIPALRASRGDLAGDLREGSRSSSGSATQQSLRGGFAVAQVTLSLILLVSAGLMIQTFARLTRVDPGFEPSGLLTTRVNITNQADSTRALQALRLDRVVASLESIPEARSVGVTRFLPFEETEWTWSVRIDGKPEPAEGERTDYGYHAVSPDYFATMGIPVVQGRGIEAGDREDAVWVAVVNEAFVGRFFEPTEDPVGRRFTLAQTPDVPMEIVGVVRDTRHYALDSEPVPAFFVPYDQVQYDWFIDDMAVVIRTVGNPAALSNRVRETLRGAGQDLLIGDMIPMEQRIADSESRRRFAMTLLTSFAAVALVIAVVGIYGLMAYSVGQRRREIGVRIALGAQPRALVARFLTTGLKTVLVGVVLGLVGAAVFARFQESLLYGVGATDPATYGLVAMVLIVAAAVATWIPARRAAQIDPVDVLGAE